MAGAKKEPRRQSERVVPSLDQGTSRVSSAAGRVSPHSGQHTRVEQRSNMPSRQSSRSVPPPSRQRSSGSSKQSPRKSSAGSRVSPSPASAPNTKDTQFIKWVSARWRSLEPHQQQRFFSVLLLLLSLLLFGSLTIFRNTFILSSISKFFLVFFGWAAYPLAFGLVAFALAHLVEGLRNQHFIRWSLVIGLCFICLLLLLESRLFTGHLAVGVLAEVLITPLLGWPPAVGHVLLIGSLLIVTIITFRLTFGHVLMVAHWIQGLFADPQRGSGSTTPQRSRGGSAASTYAGQRPQYSRYGNWPSSADPAQPSRSGRRSRVEEREEDQEDAVEFEADFGDEDPLNDINIHKNEIGTVPRHPRAAPRSLNVSEHQAATRGANQQELPFNDEEDEQPPTTQRQQRLVLQPPDLEPLAPNPKKSIWRKPSRTPQPPQPVIISPWKLPDTSLLHSPDEVKLQMLGDDTSTLARTIQETLRSFRVEAEVRPEDISIGPTVIRFGIRPTGRPE
ncbi:MAG: hypothetical protein J2P37_16205, partial [Ktedonobacteraceae bacterium]|nr:hypothetical protein [Ktedonobacteraceae bacterium]